MQVGVMKLKLYAPWVHSLKEKRMIVKSLTGKLRNKFNISVSEAEAHDVHQTIVIGVAAIIVERLNADRIWQTVISFVEENTEAKILEIEKEIR